jgi:hypothetical protein
LPEKRAANKQHVKYVPRKASKQFVVRVNRYIQMLNPKGLRLFQNVHKLRELNLKVGCETGTFPEPLPAIPSELVVESFTCCNDQEQLQITGGEFIFGDKPVGLGCTGARFVDDFHRWNNDLNYATSKGGYAPVEKAATLCFNIGYGPWQKAAWFAMILAQGQRDAKTIKPNSELLARYWFDILRGKGLHKSLLDEVSGEAARKNFLENLPKENLMQLKGVKVAPAKWMTIFEAGNAWDPTLSARALVLGSLCMSKGWVLTTEDLFSPTRLGATSCGDKPDASSKAAGLKDAKAKLERMKQRQQNTLVAAAKLLADVDVLNGIRALLHLGRPQWTGFNALIEKLTTEEKCLQHCQDWATWGWLDTLIENILALEDAPGLSRCGIESDITSADLLDKTVDSPEVKYQDALASRMHRVNDLILSHRSGSLVERCHYYPFRLAALTCENPATVKCGLAEFEKDVEAWWKAKDRYE